ncbi:hypothetical protein L596_027309 [Steinernema carpocapsae]|uniref:Uncharacterized protein n=1 Tax=Steinernema carpocapsae TaxID=34508 RepID=A0A4U5M3X2_STECR|nr:hypothetical protein L596_027309 [Steinernema carpocapsae]
MAYRDRNDRYGGRGRYHEDRHRKIEFRGRDFRGRNRSPVTINELDRQAMRQVAESGRKPHRESSGFRPERSFHPRERHFGHFDNPRHKPYGRGGRSHFKGGQDERTNSRFRDSERDREEDHEGPKRTVNIFDPSVVPKRGMYFEHDCRDSRGSKDFGRSGNPNFERPRNDHREGRGMYDPRRDQWEFNRKASQQRSVPEGWRDRERNERDAPRFREPRSDERRGEIFSRVSRADVAGKWTHDMFEAEEEKR